MPLSWADKRETGRRRRFASPYFTTSVPMTVLVSFVTARGLQDEARALLQLTRRVGSEVVPKPVYALVYPDLDDRPFLEAAVYVNGALITNNLRDFPFLDVTILGPQEFFDWLEQR